MDYLFEYLLFLGEAVTVVIAVLIIVAGIAAVGMRRQRPEKGHLEVRKLNDRLNDLKDGIRQAVLQPGQLKKAHKEETKAHKKADKEEAQALKQAESAAPDPDAPRPDAPHPGKARLFVLEFTGDIQASRVDHLRTEITAVLTMAQASDEVLVRIESPGGAVHGYGLAASQLDRIRAHGVPLTVAVDKVAASGGYLMAAVADRILAAPFAVIGSIGVLAQIPNVHRLLKKHDVDVELLTAGKYKRTLTVLGENTEEGRAKFVEELEDVHALFQEFVSTRRPSLNMEEVATGEVWYGERALERHLIDELSTSDEYLVSACADRDVYEVRWVEQRKPIERILAQVEGALVRIAERLTNVSHR